MKPRPIRIFVAWTITPLVFLLFAFPNYCDKCSYRDVARLLAQKGQETAPPCCGKKTQPERARGKAGKSDGGNHVRFSFCLTKSLSSIPEHRDVLEEIRLAISQGYFLPCERNVVRLAVVLGYKDCRGPPA